MTAVIPFLFCGQIKKDCQLLHRVGELAVGFSDVQFPDLLVECTQVFAVSQRKGVSLLYYAALFCRFLLADGFGAWGQSFTGCTLSFKASGRKCAS